MRGAADWARLTHHPGSNYLFFPPRRIRASARLLLQEERYVLEGDRAALRDIRRQVDSLRDREEAAPLRRTAGSAAAPLPASQQPPQSSHPQPPPLAMAGAATEDELGMRRSMKGGATAGAATATASRDAHDNCDADAPAGRRADVVSALRLPCFVAASGSLSMPGPSLGSVGDRASLPPPQPPATPYMAASDPPAFASSAQARAEVERLRRERRALLGSSAAGEGTDSGQAYTASHPLVRHVDRLTVLADRQAASLQAQGL